MAPVEEERLKSKGMMDEAMMNIICDDIATNTTATALKGEASSPGQIMKLPYTGSRAMLSIKQTWVTSKYKEEMHLFRCPHPRMQKKRKEIMVQFHKKRLKGKVSRNILAASCHAIEMECKGETTYVERL